MNAAVTMILIATAIRRLQGNGLAMNSIVGYGKANL